MTKIIGTLEVGICCSSIDVMTNFYLDVLGCELISVVEVPAEKSRQAAMSDAGYKVVRVELPSGERIKFVQPGNPAIVSPPARQVLERRNETYLTFMIDDFDGLSRRLEAAGADILTGAEPLEIRPGVDILFARDPEENLIEFVRYEDYPAYRMAR